MCKKLEKSARLEFGNHDHHVKWNILMIFGDLTSWFLVILLESHQNEINRFLSYVSFKTFNMMTFHDSWWPLVTFDDYGYINSILLLLENCRGLCLQCIFKVYRYQYFRRRELHIILQVMLPWYIAFHYKLKVMVMRISYKRTMNLTIVYAQ